jgi:hypothetical protein
MKEETYYLRRDYNTSGDIHALMICVSNQREIVTPTTIFNAGVGELEVNYDYDVPGNTYANNRSFKITKREFNRERRKMEKRIGGKIFIKKTPTWSYSK